jgi:hypothetical protein
MYDPTDALVAIDADTTFIMGCLMVTACFAFVYFILAARLAIRQQVYVVPFAGAALFFWHDLTYVFMYDRWFHHYHHWWLKMWWYALVGTVLFEAYMIYQIIRYGHRELWPELSQRAFAALILVGTLGVGALWGVVKASLDDQLYFVTFAITAVWSIPFHTALMVKRRSRAGQSIAMQLSVIIMISAESLAFSRVDAFFRSPIYLSFVAAFVAWPLVNIYLIRRLPDSPTRVTAATSSY